MPENKHALIVASWEYQDTDLRRLVAPANDAEALARVLADPAMGGFQVKTLLNKTCRDMSEEIERFFLDRKRDDLLLLYFSGHGLKDDDGLLYFTASDTRLIDHSRPMRSTAISADFVRDVMRCSKSRRQVLMLDCCYSGAFAGAMMAKGDKSVGLKQQFDQGRGLVVMTASDALQYSFEGDKVEGEAVQSIFTRMIVRGIETGEADLDRDGCIALDELYDYVYAEMTDLNSDQKPRKWNLDVEGKIIVAQTRIARAAELPSDLLAAIHSPLQRVRLGAVEELGDLLGGSHKGLVLAAREALAKLVNDDSRMVSMAAAALIAESLVEGVQNVPVEPTFGVIPPKPLDLPKPQAGFELTPEIRKNLQFNIEEFLASPGFRPVTNAEPAAKAEPTAKVEPAVVPPRPNAAQAIRVPKRGWLIPLPFPIPYLVLIGIILWIFFFWRSHRINPSVVPSQPQYQGVPAKK